MKIRPSTDLDLLPERRDHVFLQQRSSSDFTFDAEVVDVFDDMVTRSVPFYQEIQRMVAEVAVDFAEDGIRALARIAAEVNSQVENIGARRLQTVMEKLVEDISFTAEDRKGETLVIDQEFVDRQLAGIARNADLSRYVL